jgi:LysR family nitrogen assimilation transcriptional regulator
VNLHNLTLRKLQCFLKTVESGNITQAADALCIAQPALSLNIKQLEDALGVALLTRHARGVDVTPAGELLYSRVSALFELLDVTVRDVASLGHCAEKFFSLGMPSSLVLLVGTDAVLAAKTNLPRFSFSLREDPSFALVDAVQNNELDIALAYGASERPGVSLIPMVQEDVLFVTHPGVQGLRDVISLDEALSFDFVFGGRRDVGRCLMERVAHERGRTLNIAYEMRSIAGIREIVLRGMAATVMPYGAVASEINDGRLVARRIVDPCLTQTMSVVRSTKSTEAFAEFEPAIMDYVSALAGLIVERQKGLAKLVS